MRNVRVNRAMLLIAGLLLTAAPALAAEGGTGRKPFIQIVKDGIEVPSYFIILGSMVVIALIAEHFLMVRRETIAPVVQTKRAKEQVESRNFRDCLEELKQSKTFFAQIMTTALQHARHGFDAMHEAAVEKAGELSGRMFRKAEYLNIIGNLGPLLGLLGTVWGMIEAFASLGAGGGGAGSGELASGISKALVNTLIGLALAIMGIGFFGLCRNRIEALTVAATVEALDLLEYFRPSAKAQAERAAAAPTAGTRAPAPRQAAPATEA
jgi:biopolymer transport protein ExbB